MTLDPQGYYARLGVSPKAEQAAITAAFRQAARRLHPDIPITGDARAFVELKLAYDVLSDPLRRAAYDRNARPPLSRPPPAPLRVRQGFGARFTDVPMLAWFSILGLAIIASVSAAIRLTNGWDVPPPPASVTHPAPVEAATRHIELAGPPTHYVTPGNGPAVLWENDAGRLVPIGRLPAFTMVRAVGAVPEHGLITIALAGGGQGFVDAVRLSPGGAEDARRAFCADQAGVPPGNAEVLAQRGNGSGKVIIQNRGAEPAAVKLRDSSERTEALIYVAPGITATVLDVPGGPWHADVAMGEMWSRACRTFAAGMRAERIPGTVEQGGSLVVPPELSPGSAPVDIPDQVFMQD